MSPPVDLNQVWVNCSKCHKPYGDVQGARNGKFWLTSCAHILCDGHYHEGIVVCPVCGMDRISVLPLDGDSSKLPAEVQSFFKPFVSQLEPLYTVANFQWESMVHVCEYYQQMCLKLQHKCNRQRELLFRAKDELDKFTALKNELRSKDSSGDSKVASVTPDIKSFFSTKNATQRESQESFVSKLQNTHRLKQSRTNPDESNGSSDISNVLAESTTLNRMTPIIVSNSPTTPISFKNGTLDRSGTRSNSRQGITKQLPSALERLKLRRSSTSTISSRGILSYMRINSSQTTSGFNSRINQSKK
ncbi:unnamed protein product [Kluyveromyces dobzhanskii CBS 2104]|uniref:WGS project CCBQ000000000 data, contig 00016 n=1 Tax=Kluyveromyces dobzhanskii CBS 2104 TaxID=1427455 RepID=A0A0A8KZK6_9SACH|nr:unnamed protein product [Kluyveromyces dobzhanskii CBS 2104]